MILINKCWFDLVCNSSSTFLPTKLSFQILKENLTVLAVLMFQTVFNGFHCSKLLFTAWYRKDDLSQNLEKAKKLLDVKAAIEKLRLRNMESDDGSDLSSTTTSGSSSESDSEVAIAPVTAPDLCKPCKPSNKPQQPHHPQVTSSADEFVWIDSYNRLGKYSKYW